VASNRVLKITSQGEVRFYEALAGGLSYVALKAAAALAGSVTWTLPSVDGAVGQLLSTDGAGVLSFQSGTATLQSAYDSGKTIAIGADRIQLTIAGNNAGMSIIKAGAGVGIVLRLESAGTDESLRINHSGAGTSFALEMTGNATAALIHNTQAQACLALHAGGNSAALQITQDDGEDAITAPGADIRCAQFIAGEHVAIAHQGAVQFSDSVSVLMPSPDYFDVLTLDLTDNLLLGNSTKDYHLHLKTGAAQSITFETNSLTRLTIASTGLMSSTQTSANGIFSLTKSNAGAGTVLAISNAGVGIGFSLTQTGAEDAMRIVHSENGSGLLVTQSFNTARCLKLTKSGTGGNPCADIANAGTGNGLLITQTGDGVALQVSPSAAVAAAAITITHGAAGLVRDLEGTSANWYVTSRGNGVLQRVASTRSNLTISTGAIIVAKGGWIFLSGEGGVADDLDTITSDSNDPVVDGQLLFLKAANDAVTITVTEAGNIALDGGSKSLDSAQDVLCLIYESTLAKWLQFGFASNN